METKVINLFFLSFILSFFYASVVHAWSSANLVYTICNRTYATDLFHVNEENGVFYTHSQYLQEITYFSKGNQNFSTHIYLITMDGCTYDCKMMFRLEIGRNFSKVSPARYFCSSSSHTSPFTFNVTPVSTYFGNSPDPDNAAPPGLTLQHCNVGIHIDNNQTFNPVNDPFGCLDALTSSPPGTHSNLIQVGKDIGHFFNTSNNFSNYSPSIIVLANSVNNYAQMMNAIALGVKDGNDQSTNNLDGISDNMAPQSNSGTSVTTEIAFLIIFDIAIIAIAALVPYCTGEAVAIEAGEVSVQETEESGVLVEESAIDADADFNVKMTEFAEQAEKDLGNIDTIELAENKAKATLGNADTAIRTYRLTGERGTYEKAFYELQKCNICIERLKILGADENLVARLSSQLVRMKITLRNLINGALPFVSNNPSYMATVGFRSAEGSREIEMVSGTRFDATSSRGAYRPTENANNLGLNNAGKSSGTKKRDLQDFIFGGTISYNTQAIQTALKTIAENLNQSATNHDEFKSQVNDITSKIHAELQNLIFTNLNSSKATLLDNYMSPKLGKTNDYGRSMMGSIVKDYFTARIISTVMSSYGAVICSNDAGKVCSDNDCQCNTPIGDDSCTIAGGFGNNSDYKGYSNDDINKINQWRNVSDICQNINGWNFPHVECSTSNQCGIDKNPFFKCPNAANDCDEYDFTMPFLFW